MRLEFHPEAELELIEAALHYELEVPGLGERLESEIRRATDLLLDHPEIDRSRPAPNCSSPFSLHSDL